MATELLKRHRFTVDDYHKMGETGVLPPDSRVELIEGEVVEMSPIGRKHIARVNRITHLFAGRFGGRAIVSVQNPVRLDRHSEPQPDIALLCQRADFYESSVPTPADVLLLVEIADTSVEADRAVKVPLYARAGIRELWLMDIPGDAIEVYRGPGRDGYSSMTRVVRGGTLTPEAFPGEAIAAEELLG